MCSWESQLHIREKIVSIGSLYRKFPPRRLLGRWNAKLAETRALEPNSNVCKQFLAFAHDLIFFGFLIFWRKNLIFGIRVFDLIFASIFNFIDFFVVPPDFSEFFQYFSLAQNFVLFQSRTLPITVEAGLSRRIKLYWFVTLSKISPESNLKGFLEGKKNHSGDFEWGMSH